MRILYYDCFAGISGDMNLGALLDLGVDEKHLRNELAKLSLKGYDLRISHDIRKGISGTRVEVTLVPEQDHTHHPRHEHSHGESKPVHTHGHEAHQDHRTYREIKQMIRDSALSREVKETSLHIFERIARAEAKIHNKAEDEIHFHEVGAVDSIVDIVGAAICLQALAPDTILASTVELGSGFVQCAHGTYPVPAPATAEILSGIPVRKGSVDFEATTPTGAAILAACVHQFTGQTAFRILKTGYGIGFKDGKLPNVLRVHLGETVQDEKPEVIGSSVIECNIDDMNPEFYDFIMDALFDAGAKDVFVTPIIMKKSRPAVTLSVLTESGSEEAIQTILFRETSTLGIRQYRVEKTMLNRQIESIDTPFGKVRIKTAFLNGRKLKSKPEYEDCVAIARDRKIPLAEVYKEIEKCMH